MVPSSRVVKLGGVVAVCALACSVRPSSAALVSMPYAPPNGSMNDATLDGYLQQSVFEARLAGEFPNDTWELALWDHRGNPDGPKVTAQYNWINGGAIAFSFSYVKSTRTVIAQLGSQALTWSNVGAFTDIVIRIRATDDSFIHLTDLRVQGDDGAVTPDDMFNWEPNQRAYTDIRNPNSFGLGQLLNSFTLTGSAILLWDSHNPPPPGAQLAFQVYLTDLGGADIPTPGMAAGLGFMALLARRRRR